eukprot:m.770410 g.770410  ORF g.770410 m.770410 type:complete len:116 (+) comp23240_c0_seq17:4224-4571(+)
MLCNQMYPQWIVSADDSTADSTSMLSLRIADMAIRSSVRGQSQSSRLSFQLLGRGVLSLQATRTSMGTRARKMCLTARTCVDDVQMATKVHLFDHKWIPMPTIAHDEHREFGLEM